MCEETDAKHFNHQRSMLNASFRVHCSQANEGPLTLTILASALALVLDFISQLSYGCF